MNQPRQPLGAAHCLYILALIAVWALLLAMGRIRYLRSRGHGDSGPLPPVLLAFTLLGPIVPAVLIFRGQPSDAVGAGILLVGVAAYVYILFCGQCHACEKMYYTFREEPLRCPHCNRELW